VKEGWAEGEGGTRVESKYAKNGMGSQHDLPCYS